MKERVPAIERAQTVVAKMDRPVLDRLLKDVTEQAVADGVELEAEFGAGRVALIRACQQFARLDRDGHVEVRPTPQDAERLEAAGFSLQDPEGQVFKILGWRRLAADEGDAAALAGVVLDAYDRAKGA